MTKNSDWRVTGLGLLVLLGACGDSVDSGITATADETSTSNGTSEGSATTTQGSNSNSETNSSPTTTAGSESDSEGQTTTTTTTGPTTEAETEGATSTTDPGTSTDPGTTTEDDSTTTQGVDTTTTTDGTTTTTTGDETTGNDTNDTGDEECPLAQMHVPCDADSNDVLHAIGLNCTSLGGQWVNNQNAVTVANSVFQAAPPMQGQQAWQVAKSFGTYIDPNTNQPFWGSREGDKVLLISSGLLPPPNGQGAVIVPDGDVFNDVAVGGQWDSDSMPPPMTAVNGSPDPMGFTNCDGTNDCSNTIAAQWALGGGDAEDKMWFGFEVTSPAIANGQTADANGYTFDFAYFSAEFPEWVDTDYNDIFVVWQSSEDYTGNVTFINGQPLTVTALWPIEFQGECEFFDPNCQGSDPHLQGTGLVNEGGATGWYKATGGVKPGETFSLTFAIFDMGDSSYDTTAILDNWSWDCEGCVPNEVDDCGIAPQ
ncbi:choice-of-anchor L domain-containing protein [Nannocystis punicea]|uniref:Choice-of-anchor L domain-containing protein n=1 Tax=Nannocystis punicea TaxID=2995304 RepID=A0ABY7HII1_9BACT|nr:choice-of-anchor L domain-containing protein [Nannocystis poenicansa]WAS98749.1 choice-of-anchor L domain-containing protein [Nannocystis poenicansa]